MEMSIGSKLCSYFELECLIIRAEAALLNNRNISRQSYKAEPFSSIVFSALAAVYRPPLYGSRQPRTDELVGASGGA